MRTSKILFIIIAIFCCFISCSSDDEMENESFKIDPSFVGTWRYKNYVVDVMDENHDLALNADGTCLYSWSRITVASWQKDTYWESKGTWGYDKGNNRIVTTCTTSSAGKTVILDVASVNKTTLVVKQEGSKKSVTYKKV